MRGGADTAREDRRVAEGPLRALIERLGSSAVVVVLGDGGVGKTTLAAALAAVLARNGERVLAVTVDPSNRLRTSLGLSGPAGVEEPVAIEGFGPARPPTPLSPEPGFLHAVVLDAATEMTRLVTRLVPDDATRRRITDNVFFRKAAGTMTGTHEYAAMERLLEALESGRYTRVVLDTPPERHALDFLDAPARLDALLSSEVFQLFVRASSGLSRAGLEAIRWKSLILKGISRFAGEETFLAVLDFVLAFEPLFEGFRERAARVRTLLSGPDSATVVACRPGERCAEGVLATLSALRSRGITPAAVVANRVHAWPMPGAKGRTDSVVDAAAVKDALGSAPALSLLAPEELRDLATEILVLARKYRDLAQRDEAHVSALRSAVDPIPVFVVPLLPDEVRDLAGLARFAAALG